MRSLTDLIVTLILIYACEAADDSSLKIDINKKSIIDSGILLPDQPLSQSEQCKALYGADAEQLNYDLAESHNSDVCVNLGCFTDWRFGTYSRAGHIPASPGTPCGNGKLCVNGRCVANSNAPKGECYRGDTVIENPYGDGFLKCGFSLPLLLLRFNKKNAEELCATNTAFRKNCCNICKGRFESHIADDMWRFGEVTGASSSALPSSFDQKAEAANKIINDVSDSTDTNTLSTTSVDITDTTTPDSTTSSTSIEMTTSSTESTIDTTPDSTTTDTITPFTTSMTDTTVTTTPNSITSSTSIESTTPSTTTMVSMLSTATTIMSTSQITTTVAKCEDHPALKHICKSINIICELDYTATIEGKPVPIAQLCRETCHRC